MGSEPRKPRKPRYPQTKRVRFYARDFVPCDCVGEKCGRTIPCTPVECYYLDGAPRGGGQIDRGRVYCTCLTCGEQWRESAVPIRGAGAALVLEVDRRPFEVGEC